jgi:hypothetical protein
MCDSPGAISAICPLKAIRRSSIADACADEWIRATNRNATACKNFNMAQFRHLGFFAMLTFVASTDLVKREPLHAHAQYNGRQSKMSRS